MEMTRSVGVILCLFLCSQPVQKTNASESSYWSNQLSLRLGDGASGFAAPRSFMDWNGDGRQDLLGVSRARSFCATIGYASRKVPRA